MKTIKENKYRLIIIKMAAFLICAACFAWLAYDVTMGKYLLRGFDEAIFKGIRTLECSALTALFKLATNMVHPAVMFLISIFMIHYLHQKRHIIALVGNVIITVFLNMAVKGGIMRVRPPQEWRLVTEAGYSFPSGHSMVAASFYGFLIFMMLHSSMTDKEKRRGTVLCILMILMVGASRVYLGVHYTTDVLGGFLASTMYLILYTTLVKKYLIAGNRVKGRNPLANQRLYMSFKYAFQGMAAGLMREKNMMIHYSALIMVVVFGLTLKISKTEWMICLLLCGFVIAMEQMNTAVEAVVDLITEERRPLAKLAKDTAAGAVLAAAITAAVVGTFIFLPKMLDLLNINFM